MNTNLRCLLRACESLGASAHSLHPTANLVRIDVDDAPFFFANWSTPLNVHATARICGDKEYAYRVLAGHVRTPRTLGFIDPDVQEEYREYVLHESYDAILSAVDEEFGYPLILKRNAGSCGSNVFRCDHEAQAYAALRAIFNRQDKHYDYVALAQEYVDVKHEFRALFLDDELIFVYEKDVSEATFIGNLSPLHWQNARAVLITDEDLKTRLQEFAAPIWKQIPMRFAGLDLVIDQDDRLWLLEMNSAPAFDIYVRDNGEEEVVELYRRMVGKLAEQR